MTEAVTIIDVSIPRDNSPVDEKLAYIRYRYKLA